MPRALMWMVAALALRAQPPGAVWNTYHDHAAVAAALAALRQGHPGLLRVESAGKSAQGRDIPMAVITSGASPDGLPRVLLDGGMHGSEMAGVESMLFYIRWLVEKSETDPAARRIAGGFVTCVIPMLNPDGAEAGKLAADYRRARKNANQVDLNRNFDWHFQSGNGRREQWEYAGEEPFSEPESRALRDQLRRLQPLVYVNLHSGLDAERLIRPSATPDEGLYREIQGCAERLGPFRTSAGSMGGNVRNWAYWVAMRPLRETGAHPLSFTLEIYTVADIRPGENRRWWDRYNPPPEKLRARLEQVRDVLAYLTLAAGGARGCPR